MTEARADATPEPFLFEGGPTGVLLLHGYTGAPAEMRLIADHLHRQGLTVSGPLLPGHGTTPQELNRYKGEDWLGAARAALAELEGRCRQVFVGGLSMGAVLAIHLAVEKPELAGLLAYAPAVAARDWRRFLAPVLGRLVPVVSKPEPYYAEPEAEDRLWCYDVYPSLAGGEVLKLLERVKELVPRVTIPTFVVYTEADPVVTPEGGRFVYERVASQEKELLVLQKSGHCVTVDAEYKVVAERTWAFIRAHS
jgi:carboxylesterase